MSKSWSHEPMLEMFIFESLQLLEQLEQIIINSEKCKAYDTDEINEIFRIMHTIKGSSAMMLYNNISTLAHSIEDIFYFIREASPKAVDFCKLTDLILKSVDFIKGELTEIESGREAGADSTAIIGESRLFFEELKKTNSSLETAQDNAGEVARQEQGQKYYIGSEKVKNISKENFFKAVIYFEEGCEMENVRAFAVIHGLKELANELFYTPAGIVEDNQTAEIIRKEGFKVLFRAECPIETIRELLLQTIFLKQLTLEELKNDEEILEIKKQQGVASGDALPVECKLADREHEIEKQSRTLNQSMLSVSMVKLDKLMDLVGELVISESMVTQNPELQGLHLESFSKAARQLKKISGELQDTVMSMRMVPLSATFQRMNRIIRDMCKKLNKDVRLEILGEETEVDKNIIEHISDPLMHLIRNAIDHGIEASEERMTKGKDEVGKVTLEAKNAGGDVLVIIKDDGRGLDKEKILAKAREAGLINRTEGDLTDREIFAFILLPGFSTKENVSEFSGRGVGMDVVTKNIEKIGGTVIVDSLAGEGTTITIKIPLTLAIIGGMNIRVGNAGYTIPITSIKESFRPREHDIIADPDGNEMIMIRGQCYPIIRLHQLFGIETDIGNLHEGIIIMVENDANAVCIFADALLGEQQVVVKALPKYIKKVKSLAGCTLLGNGDISLILDIAALMEIG